ncbi:hypothetical protein CVT26_003722 [Gymnopilus dilepis]|uniref:DDE-1 domain-containing protein n=1 Tax=Gymnopilus dilepis TaxID=231916 RepID=A0A409YXL4_9AGAR|nr:hypothetical protein CVT26_003722 [Gymnopilus dilepis]
MSLPPAVIFKGEHFQTSWKQDNPLNASLGHSKKGYTDGEIGVEWIKDFDEKTKAKAKGKRRLLLVDGHNSHYTRAFLEHARKNRIRVLCYPSHSTHLYQGLDVVIFGPLKRAWSKFRDEFERKTGRAIGKTHFLAVYAQAHLEALTKENIEAAFKKTGVVPFNPDVITEAMMAPSHTTSTQSGLPVPLSSPVRVMSDMIHRVLARQASELDEEMETEDEDVLEISSPRTHDELPLPLTPMRAAVNDLSSTSLAHLVSSSPPRASSSIPLFQPNTISPFKSYNKDLLELEPHTENEARLQRALQEAEERDRRRKNAMVEMQGVTVLQNMYVRQANTHLHSREEEQKKKGEGNRLFGDGMARYLDGDEFYFNVVRLDEEAKRKKQAKAERQVARETRAQALAAWKKQEDERKARNTEIRRVYHDAVKEWEAERDAAKSGNRRPGWNKPKRGKLEKGVPRPRKPDIEDSDEEQEQEDEEEEENDDDE